MRVALRVPLTNGTDHLGRVRPGRRLRAGAPPLNAPAAAVFSTLPAFCRVTARLTPTSDSDIRIEVWLPISGWNRKVQAAGNGGLERDDCRIRRSRLPSAPAMPPPGTGHGPRRRQRRLRSRTSEKLVDFAYRAIHEMTGVGKDGGGRALRRASGEILFQLVLAPEDGRR